MRETIKTIDDLPTFEECRLRLINKSDSDKFGFNMVLEEMPTELHSFIYEQEPNNPEKAKYFRIRLFKLIKYIEEESENY